VSSAAITLWIASQRLSIIVSVYFVIDSVRKHLDIYSYVTISSKGPNNIIKNGNNYGSCSYYLCIYIVVNNNEKMK
jgi:hypothetical protein